MDPLKRTLTNAPLNQALQAWEMLRKSHREIPAQAVTVLLYVASHNPCHKQAIEEDLGVSGASCSRSISFLSGIGRPGVKRTALGLIETETDGSNRRRLLLKLTPKGEAAMAEVSDLLFSSESC